MGIQSKLSSFPAVGMLMASPFVLNQLMKIIFDQELLDADPAGQGPRKFVILTSAVNQGIAKVKARVFISGMRPKRRITDLQLGVVEQGPLVKLYQVEILTDLLGDGEETD